MADKRPMPEKLPEFREKLVKLCQEYEIEIVAVLNRSISMDASEMHFVDVNNPEQLKKYGLAKKQNNDPSSLLVN